MKNVILRLIRRVQRGVIVGLFEEVGWRGFALPGLQLRLDAIWAALALGSVAST